MERMFLTKCATVAFLLFWSLVPPTVLGSEPDELASQMNSFIGSFLESNTEKQKTDYDYGVCIDSHQRYDFTVLYKKYKELGGPITKEQFNEAIEKYCIPVNFVEPKTYLLFTYGFNKFYSRTSVSSRDYFRVADVYLDRTLPFSGTFFEGVISVSDQESDGSTAENRGMHGSAFGRIAFAPEGKLDTVPVNQQYRPSHKGKGMRLVFGLNAGKSDISAYGFDIEAGYRNTDATSLFGFDVFGRARWWLYDDSEQNAIYTGAITAKHPPTPFPGWQFDLGIGYQDNTAIDTESLGFGGGIEIHRLKPLIIRFGVNRRKVISNANEQNEYDTQISFNLIYSFPALRYNSPESDTQEGGPRTSWIKQIWSIAGSGSGGRLYTIDELSRPP